MFGDEVSICLERGFARDVPFSLRSNWQAYCLQGWFGRHAVKPFEFRLDSVLRLKVQLLEMEEARLANLVQMELDLMAQLRESATELRRQQDLLLAEQSVSGAVLGSYAAFQAEMKQRMERVRQAIEKVRRKQDDQRQKIRQLRTEREMLQRLRERQFREWWYRAEKETEALAQESHLNRLVREQSAT